jgi:hypothetical protein
MHKNVLLVVLVLLMTTGLGAAFAQAAARQGVAPPPDIIKFESPMILDLPLPNVGAVEAGSQLQLPNVRKYICDNDVQLLNLAIGKQYKGPKRARSLDLVVSGSVFVADSYDRRVDIALRLRSGEDVVASQILRNYSTEEERTTPFRILLPVVESRLLAAFSAEPAPILELTLTIRDDS